jgi:hypothetical protein
MPTEDDITAYQRRLQALRGTLRHYLDHRAKMGALHVRPGNTHGITETRDEIRMVKQVLREWGSPAADHPDDDDQRSTHYRERGLSEQEAPFEKASASSLHRRMDSKRISDRINAKILLFCLVLGMLLIIAVWRITSLRSGGRPDVNALRSQILREETKGARDTLVHRLWIEAESGLHQNNQYDPSGCPHQGYGVAWNVSYNEKPYPSEIIVFSTPKQLVDIGGGWYVQLCLNEGVSLSADEVGLLQSAILTKDTPGNWRYSVIE